MRYVIKIGTSSLFNEDGIKENVLKDLLETIKDIFNDNNEVVIVVSGAIACGKRVIKQITDINDSYIEYNKIQSKLELIKNLKDLVEITNDIQYKRILKRVNLTTVEKSIIAGIGQCEMMRIIQNEAFNYGILTEQILLSGKSDLKRSIAMKNIEKCFSNKILAVVNANDTVYEEELIDENFSDNDNLASDLAKMINADKLFLITNVDGYLDNNEIVSEIALNNGYKYLNKTKKNTSSLGTGGMYSKLKNALEFTTTGGMSYIISVNNISSIIDISEDKTSKGTKIYNKTKSYNTING